MPLFVIGMYRSGTSLLYGLLNQHPAIAIMYECDSLAALARKPSAENWPHWAERNELWNQTFLRHRITSTEFLETRDLRSLYEVFARRSGATFYGEKSPAYARCLRKLVRRFPDASIIVLLRELPEIYQSMLDAGKTGARFFRRKGQLPRLIWSHRQMLRTARSLEAQGVPVLRLDYREMVDNPESVARRVCEFLKLEYCEGMTSLVGSDLSAIYQASHHQRVRSEKIVRRVHDRARISSNLQEELRTFAIASGQETLSMSEPLPLGIQRRISHVLYLAFGSVLCLMDDGKRLLYEYLPASWFRTYRRICNRRPEESVTCVAGQESN